MVAILPLPLVNAPAMAPETCVSPNRSPPLHVGLAGDRAVRHESRLFEDEGHGVRLPDSRVAYVTLMVPFFEEHL